MHAGHTMRGPDGGVGFSTAAGNAAVSNHLHCSPEFTGTRAGSGNRFCRLQATGVGSETSM